MYSAPRAPFVQSILFITTLMFGIPNQSHAARAYSDGLISSTNAVCPVTGNIVVAASSYVGYYTDPAEPFPTTGEIGYVHAVAANVSACVNDAISLEVALPDGAVWAISPALPVRCWQTKLDGTSTTEVTGANNNLVTCLQSPSAGPNGGALFGFSALAPGWLYEIQIPVQFTKRLLGTAGPNTHKLTAAATSAYGTMLSSKAVNVPYRARFENMQSSNVGKHNAGVSLDLHNYYSAGTLYVDYGTSAAFGSTVTLANIPATAVGASGLTATLSGLSAGTHYLWRARFATSIGTFTSTTASFNTLGNGGVVGDPHMTTVNGIHYDFQAAGEFVLLRDPSLEVQARNAAFATDTPSVDPYTGLASCISMSTAVALRVGPQRITYQPQANAREGLELRIDGVAMNAAEAAIELADGARVERTGAPGGLHIHTPAGVDIVITPGYVPSTLSWILNLEIRNTQAAAGLLGTVEGGAWLPALPDGSSLGSQPSDQQLRHDTLYAKLGEAWRVRDADSLFDYAPGTSTRTYTPAGWPEFDPKSCKVPGQTPVTQSPVPLEMAQSLCRPIAAPERRANCETDIVATGETTLAQTYVLMQQVEAELGQP